MQYKDPGSKIKDAECKCEDGFHFENEDQRACVPNKICPKGFGQGLFGVCEECIKKNMWSDVADRKGKCKPLRNCEKEGRCTVVKSNGTTDNKCGPKVSDVTDCDSLINTTPEPEPVVSEAAIYGSILGAIAVFLLLIALIVWYIIRRRQAARRSSSLTREELDELLEEICKRCRKDETYCKKVLSEAQRQVEDEINQQIWDLPRELFRNHIQPAKFELIVESYKGQPAKYAINGYMNDWRSWKGDSPEAVEELIKGLNTVKREDIVYKVVNKLREDYPAVVANYSSPNNRSSKPSGAERFFSSIFPCLCDKNNRDASDNKDTSTKLLDSRTTNENGSNIGAPPPDYSHDGGLTPTDAGMAYRKGPTPSAPVITDPQTLYEPNVKPHFYDRSESLPDSVPVQASS